MNAVKRSPLDTLIELTRQSRDGAGKSLADDRKRSLETISQLETLADYRQEYANQLQDMLRRGTDTAMLHNYQQFLRTLDAAIARARETLSQQEQRVASSRQQWQQQQQQLSSYDTLAGRRAQQQRRQEQRREQVQSDELTSNMSARQRQQSDPQDQ
ncbi:flagellar export protein FliJ [Kineobactrum salinum]|uniref:Flagellar FliJ protein n=1 Tax=Kineobactrum salinum TaxID=2708301 RepID=A0A6C0TXR6_9GAMM|nr:flagellar export protein FliJ [Kineobactrum salinum]QIB64323.1 flagellar export protein FliJ [Kineobactrum salinum]